MKPTLLLFRQLCGGWLLAVLSFAQTALASADYQIDVWRADDGLPQGTVTSVVQTPDGYLWFGTQSGLVRFDGVAFRVFNANNTRRSKTTASCRYAAAVPIFIDRAVKNQPITIYGDGEQTRDFIYVKDNVAANVFFATQSQATGVFNVAYGQKITIQELAQQIIALTNSKSEITHAPERAGDVKHSLAAIDKLRAAGFAPTSNFADGLATTIRFHQNQAKQTSPSPRERQRRCCANLHCPSK